MKDYSVLLPCGESTMIVIHDAFDKGYQQGYKDAGNELGQNAIDLAHEESDRAYQQGLEDAWEAARKLALSSLEGGFYAETIAEIFDGLTYYMVFKDVPVSEAIAKIKEYEDKQKQDAEIKVGDEVYSDAIRKKAIVTYITDDGNYIAITSNGSLMIKEGLHRLHKTGRHFDQIAEVLAEMRGDKE